MPDYYSPDGPPPFKQVDCDNLFELLMSKVDKPHEHMHIIAELLCKALQTSSVNNIEYVGGVPMHPDQSRGNKVLSLSRPIIHAGVLGENKCNQYLKISEVPSAGAQGFLIPRKATITGIWAKSRSAANWTIEARRNNVSLTLASATVSGGQGSSLGVDIDLDAGDCLQIFANGDGIAHPVAAVELAWRK